LSAKAQAQGIESRHLRHALTIGSGKSYMEEAQLRSIDFGLSCAVSSRSKIHLIGFPEAGKAIAMFGGFDSLTCAT
jgi:hypothetical protein